MIEFNARITKIKKQHGISYGNNEIHENHEMPKENYENHEKKTHNSIR